MKINLKLIATCCAVLFGAAFLTAETAWSGDISCDGGFDYSPKQNNTKPLATQTDTLTECMRLFAWESITPQDSAEAQQQYDSLRLYIETCAASDSKSWQVFIHLDGAVGRLDKDSTIYDSYRAWLISVLYLNTTTPQYFCACLGAIADSYQYGKYHPLGYFAVNNYIRNYHPECIGATDSADYAEDSAYYTQNGYDLTHLPSLDSMGLGFLLNPNLVAHPSTPLSSQYLASFTTNPNPFKDETTLTFTLNRMAYVTVAIYDVLGHWVWGASHGASLDAGTHQIRIDGANLPSGSLYARISTGFGEVKTVKIVHEN